jgi:hypothetical protein
MKKCRRSATLFQQSDAFTFTFQCCDTIFRRVSKGSCDFSSSIRSIDRTRCAQMRFNESRFLSCLCTYTALLPLQMRLPRGALSGCNSFRMCRDALVHSIIQSRTMHNFFRLDLDSPPRALVAFALSIDCNATRHTRCDMS